MNKVNIQEQLMNQKRKVDFNTYDLSVKELINMVNEGIIDIAPDYQRQFRWDEERQSMFVESIFLGIPIPSLFMATDPDGTWELIDGVQRVSSIVNFAGNEEEREKIWGIPKKPLKLQGLEKLTEFNGKAFSELPLDIQMKFKLASIKVTTLSDKSDLGVRFDLFERLNRGGVILSDQEIRSCVYRGEFNDFLKEMAKDANFNLCIRLPEAKDNDGTREEMVLRFFAYLYNYKEFVHSVKDFLNSYMEESCKKFNYERNEKIFRTVFKELAVALPDGITKGRKVTPINLYEGVAVGAAVAWMKKKKIDTTGIKDWIQCDELKKYTTGATNSRNAVIGRIEFCTYHVEIYERYIVNREYLR